MATLAGEVCLKIAALGAGSALHNARVLLGPPVLGAAELGRIAARLAADQARDDLELVTGGWPGPASGYLAARAIRPLHLAACWLAIARSLSWPAAEASRAEAA
jgi:hypothetical protein